MRKKLNLSDLSLIINVRSSQELKRRYIPWTYDFRKSRRSIIKNEI